MEHWVKDPDDLLEAGDLVWGDSELVPSKDCVFNSLYEPDSFSVDSDVYTSEVLGLVCTSSLITLKRLLHSQISGEHSDESDHILALSSETVTKHNKVSEKKLC